MIRRTLALLLMLAPTVTLAAPERGVDVSSLASVESHGATFAAGAAEGDALTLLRHAGIDAVRLRLWHTPADANMRLPAMLRLAKRARALDMRLLLDLHYSDTWADPGHQTPPAAWQGLEPRVLADSTARWTRDVVAAFVAQGTPPAQVQIGNEVDHGMLWEIGRRGRDEASRARFAFLFARAADAARAACPTTRILLHVSGSLSPRETIALCEDLAARHASFDALGVSYYPLWHGSLDRLRTWLTQVGAAHHPADHDRGDRLPMDAGMVRRYPQRPRRCARDAAGPAGESRGQVRFVQGVEAALAALPEVQRGGIYWWEPAWVAVRGAGSPWENATLFDAKGERLPAAQTLGHTRSSR
jgi:arabinogalactan endo-1,4-beta-galactosidase